ncbi:MAG TPA: putative Ig domain-containing protein [Thermoanaerobaculia bacterium]
MKHLRLTALCALFLCSFSPLFAEYVPRWASTYDPSSNVPSQSTKAGRLLADGSFMLVATEGNACTVVRFDANGTVLTKASFTPPEPPRAYQLSPFGEVYVLGNDSVMKYDGVTGAAAWPAAAGFPNPELSGRFKLILDPFGNAIVAWHDGNLLAGRKLSGVDGSILWTSTLATASLVTSWSVATDSFGNAFLTSTVVGVAPHVLTMKLQASDGTLLWWTKYDRGNDDRPLILSVDAADDVYLAGTVGTPSTDIAIVKYRGASGAELWRTTSAGPLASSDTPVAVTFDAEQNLVIAGTYVNGSYTDMQFLKYTPAGMRAMHATVSGLRDDAIAAIAVDGFGDILYAGTSGGGPSDTDLVAGRINGRTGAAMWSQTYGRTTGQHDSAAALAVLPSGDVLLGGTSYGTTTREDITFLRHAGASGARLATAFVDGNGAQTHSASIMAAGSANELYVAGGNSRQKFDLATGAGLASSMTTTNLPGGIAVDGAGNQYDFTTQFGTATDYSLAKRSATGTLLWQRTWGATSSSSELAITMTLDSAANPIVTGTSAGSFGGSAIVTTKFNAAGTQQWMHTFTGTAGGNNDRPVAVVTNAAGDVFVAGTVSNSGTANDLVVLKIDGVNGGPLWATTINGAPSGVSDDAAFALALDPAGNPVVTGRFGSGTTSDFGAVKLNASTGAILWNTAVPTPGVGDEPRAIAIDTNGDVVLLGTTNLGASSDLFTVKLAGADGIPLWMVPYDGGFGADHGVALRITSSNEIVVLGTVAHAAPAWTDLALIRYTPKGSIATGPLFYDSGSADSAVGLLLLPGNDPLILGRNNDRVLLVRYSEKLGIETLRLAPAYSGLPYQGSIVAKNGTPPYHFSISSGFLPPGLMLHPSSGAITGTASIAGAPFTVRARVTDAAFNVVERDFRIDGFSGSPILPLLATADPVCGSATTLSAPEPWTSHRWLPNGETTPSISPLPLHPTLFGVQVESGIATARGARHVNVVQPLTAATISLAGSAVLCGTPTGGTATLATMGGGTTAQQWGYRTAPGGAITPLAGKTALSYVITASDFPGSGTYFLVATVTPYCGAPVTTDEIAVTISSITTPRWLTASATANNEITLTWSSSGAVDHFIIYRSSGLCPGNTFTKIGESTGESFIDTTVTGGQLYSYKVTAVSTGPSCETSFSNCAGATASGTCVLPPSFTGATMATPNGCSLLVQWPAATSRCPLARWVVYNVYRSTTPTFTPSASNRVASCLIANSYEDHAITLGTTYYYIVRAEDATTGGSGPCHGGNEDTNLLRVNTITNGATQTVTLFADAFEAPNRPGSTPDAYWVEQTELGAEQLSLSHCTSASGDTSYKWGSTLSSCSGGYDANVRNHLLLGGDGSVSSSINGLTIPPLALSATLAFQHYYRTELLVDGVALYYSTTGPNGPFLLVNDAPATGRPYISSGGYNGTISSDGRRRGWSGTQNWTPVLVTINGMAGQTVWFRWRFASNALGTAEGYYLDDVTLTATMPVTCPAAPGQ